MVEFVIFLFQLFSLLSKYSVSTKYGFIFMKFPFCRFKILITVNNFLKNLKYTCIIHFANDILHVNELHAEHLALSLSSLHVIGQSDLLTRWRLVSELTD